MQKNIWRAENFGDTVSEMVFLRDFEARQACIDEHKTGCLDIHNQEPGDPKDDTQYVTYDSGIHGAFTTQERQNLVRFVRRKNLLQCINFGQNGLHLSIRIRRNDKHDGWNGQEG